MMMLKSSVEIEVDVRGGKIFIKSLRAGARDFFGGAPWPVVDGTGAAVRPHTRAQLACARGSHQKIV